MDTRTPWRTDRRVLVARGGRAPVVGGRVGARTHCYPTLGTDSPETLGRHRVKCLLFGSGCLVTGNRPPLPGSCPTPGGEDEPQLLYPLFFPGARRSRVVDGIPVVPGGAGGATGVRTGRRPEGGEKRPSRDETVPESCVPPTVQEEE